MSKQKKEPAQHEYLPDSVPYHLDVNHDRLKKVRDYVFERVADTGCDPDAVYGTGFDIVYHLLREYRPDLFVDSQVLPGKYKTPEALVDVLKPGEPWFVLLGRDVNAVGTLCDYTRRLEDGKSDPACIEDMRNHVIVRFAEWQEAHPGDVKSVTGTGHD
jgi:hypothetical protein